MICLPQSEAPTTSWPRPGNRTTLLCGSVAAASSAWLGGVTHSALDYIPPEENETAYYAPVRASQPAMPQT